MKFAFLLSLLFVTQDVFGLDLGQLGTVFTIKEQGIINMLQERMKIIDIDKYKKQMIDKAKTALAEPKPVSFIKRTELAREFTYDPSYIVDEDIILPSGQILYKKGTKYNPLETIELGQRLIFIDARDKSQIAWLGRLQVKPEDKIILIAGRPLELEEKLDREVYFDQSGEITKKLTIEQVPAIAEQSGNLLKIREVKIDEEGN